MERITLDADLIKKLRGATHSIEVCSESGEVVGLFTPKINPADYEGLEPEISEEELDRRMNSNEPRYTTAEVLRYLERL